MPLVRDASQVIVRLTACAPSTKPACADRLTCRPTINAANEALRKMGIVAEVTGQWLDPLLSDVTRLQLMLEPYPERLMWIYPVSKRVNLPLWMHLREKHARSGHETRGVEKMSKVHGRGEQADDLTLLIAKAKK